MTPRIQKAIDIFLDAINEGHLAKGDCTACAVGNMVRVGMGLTRDQYNLNSLSRDGGLPYINWSMIFSTDDNHQKFKKGWIRIFRKFPQVQAQIESTGFTVKELAKIEYAFETGTSIHYTSYNTHSLAAIRADQIRGLEAVVKVMLGFDNQQDDVNEVFTKRAELIPV